MSKAGNVKPNPLTNMNPNDASKWVAKETVMHKAVKNITKKLQEATKPSQKDKAV